MPEALPTEKQLSVRSLWDQGREVDCCLSCALAICFEALELTGPELAPLYHYWWARPDPTVATPLKLTAAFGVTQMKGFCRLPLHEYPLTPVGALIQPSPSANDDAKDRRLGFDMETGEPLRKWLSRWDAVRRWKQALAGNFPILIGLALDDDYWAMQGGQRSRWEPAGQAIGSVGHAVAVTGYSDTNEVFTIQDSRGKGFGEQGRWHLPYAHARANKIVSAYVIGTAE